MTTTAIDQDKLDALLGLAVGDMGAAASTLLVHVGDRLGIYAALNEGGPQTVGQLATRTGLHERLLLEWLSNQAAGAYVTYEEGTELFSLSPEQAFLLADPTSPVYLGGLAEVIVAISHDAERIAGGIRTGQGVHWHDHHEGLFTGTERFFRPGYAANLVPSWIPALDGVDERLRAGIRVADVGCGHGASTIVMAQAYPASTFVGSDYHAPSIDAARKATADAGVADRVSFEVAKSSEFGSGPYDLVCLFDCLHDMGDPVAAARHIRSQLAPGGTLLLVEPNAGDSLSANLNPVGRLFYAASTAVCTANGVAQGGSDVLGAQAGEARTRAVFEAAGWSSFRRATETPFNAVFEVRA
jgi:2-polyprenyl-3-methyl-5-hydroxy-6-metoxy-1,4-benzoquinol methylase